MRKSKPPKPSKKPKEITWQQIQDIARKRKQKSAERIEAKRKLWKKGDKDERPKQQNERPGMIKDEKSAAVLLWKIHQMKMMLDNDFTRAELPMAIPRLEETGEFDDSTFKALEHLVHMLNLPFQFTPADVKKLHEIYEKQKKLREKELSTQ